VSSIAAGWIRWILLLLAVVQAAVGGWIVVRPNTFYDNWFVALDMPYNEHLTLDLGAFNLAFGVLLGCAAVSMERRLVQVTLASYLVYTIAHETIHLTHTDHLTQSQLTVLLFGLAANVLLPAALLVLTRWLPTRPNGLAPLTAARQPERNERPRRLLATGRHQAADPAAPTGGDHRSRLPGGHRGDPRRDPRSAADAVREPVD